MKNESEEERIDRLEKQFIEDCKILVTKTFNEAVASGRRVLFVRGNKIIATENGVETVIKEIESPYEVKDRRIKLKND